MKTTIAIIILVAFVAGLNIAIAIASLELLFTVWSVFAAVAALVWAVAHLTTERTND
jgi:hypothetical protein